jgi:hypothetical protein
MALVFNKWRDKKHFYTFTLFQKKCGKNIIVSYSGVRRYNNSKGFCHTFFEKVC